MFSRGAGSSTGAQPYTAGAAREILLVGSEDWAIRQAHEELTDAGRVVHRCHESAESPFPCNALIAGVGCPLDRHSVDVVLDVRARPRADPSLGEMGAMCGLRAGLPLVVAGLSGAMKLAPWASQVPPHGTILENCDAAVEAHAAAERPATDGAPVGTNF
ncbi:MAG TPA: hypothetical protein VKU91_04925 [Acidimicrobiales bacterium]|nr:hypothetical protein [Acidimicrobiales bacterium]